jgi:hypothetical protein
MEAVVTFLGIGEIRCFMMEGRQGADHANHDRHRSGISPEALVKLDHLLVYRGILSDRSVKRLFLPGIWQLAILQQTGDLEKVAMPGKLLDRIAAVEEITSVAIMKLIFEAQLAANSTSDSRKSEQSSHPDAGQAVPRHASAPATKVFRASRK